MDVVKEWYADAEELLLRTRFAIGWRDTLRVKKSVALFGEPSPDDWKTAVRDANKKSDEYCDAIEAMVQEMEADVFALGKRFDNAWIDLFWLGLRNIEIEGLPAGRCALAPLQELIFTVRNRGRKLIHAHYQSGTLNCDEVSDFIDFERWILTTVDLIRERFLLERLTILEKLEIFPKGSTHNGPSSEVAIAADRESLERIEEKTPALDTESVEWIAARKENEKKLGLLIKTLRDYRTQSFGGRTLSAYFGVDRDGRRWRRDTNRTQTSTVYYFKSSLPKRTNKPSN